jgi:glucans biosynthesis protein
MPNSSLPSRRFVLVAGAATLGGSVLGWPLSALAADQPPLTADGPFTRSTVTEMARALSKTAYAPPSQDLPPAVASLTAEQYHGIQYRPDAAVWANDQLPFELQLFHRGSFYKDKVELAVVDPNGNAHHIAYAPSMFTTAAPLPKPLPTDDIGFAGFRIHGHINHPDLFDEIAVFEGASYFRSLGKGEVYGISARGLALKVGAPDGEEFPIFRAFWVETPEKGSDSITVHALLDSKSVTGAYRFTIRPGLPTTMDVETTLFPRTDLVSPGIAVGTSMFFFSGNGRGDIDDWRPQVHDSDGLLMINGLGERLWRPLANPKDLQFSGFVDSGPRGFGLMQRNRNFDNYQDFDADYEKRPSLWIEPVGDWGKGSVVLVEIPSTSEGNDNIVAFWQPADQIKAGSEFSYAYRMFWGNGPALPGMIVEATRQGRADPKKPEAVRHFVIDYAATGAVDGSGDAPGPAAMATPVPAGPTGQPAVVAAAAPGTATPTAAGDPATSADPAHDPKPVVTASAGAVSNIWLEPNPVTGGWRLAFDLDAQKAPLVELRVELRFQDKRPVDTWLYRWTA